jgi:hypothetical protein
MNPFFEEAGVATPLVKVSEVALPKLIAVPPPLTTDGRVPPGLAEAPEKTTFFDPVYAVAVLP